MNESNCDLVGSRERCTAKAIPPRWRSDGLLRPPTFPPCETKTAESSTFQAFVSPQQTLSQPCTKYSPSSLPKSSSDADIFRPQVVDPTHLDKAACSTESIGNLRSSVVGNTRPIHRGDWVEPFSNTPLGWVGKRAYQYQVRLALHSDTPYRSNQRRDPKGRVDRQQSVQPPSHDTVSRPPGAGVSRIQTCPTPLSLFSSKRAPL